MSKLQEAGRNLVRAIEAKKKAGKELAILLCEALKPLIPDIYWEMGIIGGPEDEVELNTSHTMITGSKLQTDGGEYLKNVLDRTFREFGVQLEGIESDIWLTPEKVEQVQAIIRYYLTDVTGFLCEN